MPVEIGCQAPAEAKFHTIPLAFPAFDPVDSGAIFSSHNDTPDEAAEAAKKLHAEEVKIHEEMVEYAKKEHPDRPWLWANGCYDGCIVTSDEVFRLSAPKDGDAKKGEG